MAAAGFEMDAWKNRYRVFAEGVVIMVCPVLLAIALKKVNLKCVEERRAVPIIMLVVAAVTLIAGIFPFLICCFSKRKFSNGTSRSPHAVTKWLTPLSSMCLVVLACWIIHLIFLDNWVYPAIGAVVGLCIVIRSVEYCCGKDAQKDATRGNEEYCSKLDNSLEFLVGMTALLFLGLEGLALEGQINSTTRVQGSLTKPIGASFVACVIGVCLMLFETIPPHNIKSNLTEILDILTTFAVSMVMFFIMYSLMKLRALHLIAPPFLILLVHAFHVAVSRKVDGGNARGEESDEGYKLASLELTKVTFTGFLAVSIPSISNGSLDMCTECFIHLSASAIVSGLIWRLLTHIKSHSAKAIANVASCGTHLCVGIATIPFTVMAGKALSIGDATWSQGGAPAPC